jgi:hypothetical protein
MALTTLVSALEAEQGAATCKGVPEDFPSESTLYLEGSKIRYLQLGMRRRQVIDVFWLLQEENVLYLQLNKW